MALIITYKTTQCHTQEDHGEKCNFFSIKNGEKVLQKTCTFTMLNLCQS